MTDLIKLIDAELSALRQARALIVATDKRKPGRPTKVPAAPAAKPKRKMSPEARARIAAAQKKRWAAQKAAK